MVYNMQNYWVLGLCLSPGILKNTTFLQMDLFPSSGKGQDTYSVGAKSKNPVILSVKNQCSSRD
jgi:hypothetical protein